jgi:hypothetical protein
MTAVNANQQRYRQHRLGASPGCIAIASRLSSHEKIVSHVTVRQRLDNRRASEQIAFECAGFRYVATVSQFPDGRLAEIFLTNGKCGSDSDVSARDAAVVASLALQHGVPVETLRKALMRDSLGRANGPLGTVLDLFAGEQEHLNAG